MVLRAVLTVLTVLTFLTVGTTVVSSACQLTKWHALPGRAILGLRIRRGKTSCAGDQDCVVLGMPACRAALIWARGLWACCCIKADAGHCG